MKFEFSRSFLMGLALAGLLTSCGGSNSWTDSPDDWAQAAMPAAVSAPAKPKKAPETPVVETPVVETPVVLAPATEADVEPKKSSWWNKDKKEEASPELAGNAPASAPVAPAPKLVPSIKEPAKEKKSLWQAMRGDMKADETAVAEKKAEKKAVAPSKPAPAAKKKGDFPTAERVSFISGYVHSPYDNRHINVRGVASGSLVADPRYPLDQKKYFRVP